MQPHSAALLSSVALIAPGVVIASLSMRYEREDGVGLAVGIGSEDQGAATWTGEARVDCVVFEGSDDTVVNISRRCWHGNWVPGTGTLISVS